ncbi:flavodoxin domain-containing protein [Citricoccus sp. CH26A]|uniref:flavodoxin domain-containing protein n=1 Tax=Citricoccus TaxID=169133 RepID=UPI001145E38D|nr:flavodoxin domain-containing protein [Citricoccus sp. CH26A]
MESANPSRRRTVPGGQGAPEEAAPRVLVGYASAHGSTAEIAQRIAEVLGHAGLTVEVLPLQQAPSPEGYAAVVLGSAIHQQEWLPTAAGYIARHAPALRERPVWLFSVGMTSALPRWIRRSARAGQDRRLAQALRDQAAPRGHLLVSGVVTPGQFPRWVRTLFRVFGARFGDYRDWARIEAWAQGIAGSLTTVPPRHAARS